ncbi:hypothetical protein [Parafilimonas sp.]|uniref:hypothetical protein n=1 Tax=Parafilimonas sp. TaxID=1969739 RepID=UPI003F7F7A0E
MLSIRRVVQYVTDDDIDIETLKQYFEKSLENLKNLNKRSIRITQFILMLIVLYFFRKNFTHIKLFEIDFDVKLLRLLTPTLISYLLFEWLMIAKRRRDLIFGIQQLSYRLFKIKPNDEERLFPGFNPNTLNIMPYSFMCEVLSISDKSGVNRRIYKVTIKLIFVLLIIIMGTSFYEYWNIYDFKLCFVWPTSNEIFIETFSFYATLLVTLLFTGWVIFYYYLEFKNIKEIRIAKN